jgi:hypothetical protein
MRSSLALLQESGEAWPQTRDEASELIDRLRERDESSVVP